MRRAEANPDLAGQARGMLRQRGVGMSEHDLPQLWVARWRQLRGTTGAGTLRQRLALTMPGQPAVDRPDADAKVRCRFTRWQPRVDGGHQALTEVGRGASGHAPACRTVTSSARCSS